MVTDCEWHFFLYFYQLLAHRYPGRYFLFFDFSKYTLFDLGYWLNCI